MDDDKKESTKVPSPTSDASLGTPPTSVSETSLASPSQKTSSILQSEEAKTLILTPSSKITEANLSPPTVPAKPRVEFTTPRKSYKMQRPSTIAANREAENAIPKKIDTARSPAADPPNQVVEFTTPKKSYENQRLSTDSANREGEYKRSIPFHTTRSPRSVPSNPDVRFTTPKKSYEKQSFSPDSANRGAEYKSPRKFHTTRSPPSVPANQEVEYTGRRELYTYQSSTTGPASVEPEYTNPKKFQTHRSSLSVPENRKAKYTSPKKLFMSESPPTVPPNQDPEYTTRKTDAIPRPSTVPAHLETEIPSSGRSSETMEAGPSISTVPTDLTFRSSWECADLLASFRKTLGFSASDEEQEFPPLAPPVGGQVRPLSGPGPSYFGASLLSSSNVQLDDNATSPRRLSYAEKVWGFNPFKK